MFEINIIEIILRVKLDKHFLPKDICEKAAVYGKFRPYRLICSPSQYL